VPTVITKLLKQLQLREARTCPSLTENTATPTGHRVILVGDGIFPLKTGSFWPFPTKKPLDEGLFWLGKNHSQLRRSQTLMRMGHFGLGNGYSQMSYSHLRKGHSGCGIGHSELRASQCHLRKELPGWSQFHWWWHPLHQALQQTGVT